VQAERVTSRGTGCREHRDRSWAEGTSKRAEGGALSPKKKESAQPRFRAMGSLPGWAETAKAGSVRARPGGPSRARSRWDAHAKIDGGYGRSDVAYF